MRRVAQFALTAATIGILSLTGCAQSGENTAAGSGGDAGSVIPDDSTSQGTQTFPPVTTTPPPSAAPVPSAVSISVDDGAGNVSEYTLTCAPQGGNHPDAAAACSALAAGTAVFAPADPNQACTEIFGGPQTATVTGTVNGVQLSGTFSRANGCEIARWDALAAVFANAGGA